MKEITIHFVSWSSCQSSALPVSGSSKFDPFGPFCPLCPFCAFPKPPNSRTLNYAKSLSQNFSLVLAGNGADGRGIDSCHDDG